ncbi:uncharacterized protein LOC110177946 [Drosophila serrata]|uniref:uncharacterized protein LOC110177946 n=1 Tax=Drosophila serrata TaxID=7274 RepID=UPI000A1CF3E9|nr:uncharacterized protein LOC110177946 [Drosophila serrata]
MSTSILATMCAERLTKILVRYSRGPAQPTLVRNESKSQSQSQFLSHSQCPLRSVNPLPRSEATVAYLKPLASGGQVQSLGKPAAKWQPLASFSNISQKFQQVNMAEQPLLRAKTQAPQFNYTRNIEVSPSKSKGSQDWKQLGSSRFSAPFASIFQGQSIPLKPFGQDSLAFHANKVYRDCC